jgi:hypothetical protein
MHVKDKPDHWRPQTHASCRPYWRSRLIMGGRRVFRDFPCIVCCSSRHALGKVCPWKTWWLTFETQVCSAEKPTGACCRPNPWGGLDNPIGALQEARTTLRCPLGPSCHTVIAPSHKPRNEYMTARCLNSDKNKWCIGHTYVRKRNQFVEQ